METPPSSPPRSTEAYGEKASREIGILVTPAGRPIGWARRAFIRRHNLLHSGIGILCRDAAGRIYVHKRTDTKDVFPGAYDMLIGGVVLRGESYLEAARRELEEELGIRDVPLRRLLRHLYLGEDNRSLVEVYEVTWNGPIRPQEEEIAWGAFMTPEELERWIQERPFVPDGLEIYRRLQAEGFV